MAELKTQPTDQSVDGFLDAIADDARRQDCEAVRRMMEDITGEAAVMWGEGIVGFGRYQFKYASGREGAWFVAGFSPRKQALTLYIMSGFKGHAELMEQLGKHKTGRSCLYLRRLSDVDADVLHQLVAASVAHVSRRRLET